MSGSTKVVPSGNTTDNTILRDKAQQTSESLLKLSVLLGLVKYSAVKTPNRGRQLTLDIRKRVSHGIPVKGGIGKPATVGQLKVAAAAAGGAFKWGSRHLKTATVLECNKPPRGK